MDEETRCRDRMSIALFVHPNHETEIRPFGAESPEVGSEEAEQERRFRTAKEHIDSRFKETYQK